MTSCIRVSTSNRACEFQAEPGERVLHAALRSGVALPYECASGTCGTCRATVTGGTAVSLWPEAPGQRKLRGASDVLTCQIAAGSDLTLAIRGNIGEAETVPSHMRGRMTLLRRLNAEIAEFTVALDQPMAFLAGQFVLLELPGIEGPRAYSMSTRPGGRAKILQFLIRSTSAGLVTRRLFGAAQLDEPVRLFGPLGRATFTPAERRPFVAIAGGSGIAGMLSILDHAAESGHFESCPSRLVFGLRTAETAYLLDELSAYARRFPAGLEITIAFSDSEPQAAIETAYPHLRFAHGLAHDVARALPIQDGTAPLYYVAGPPPMVDATLRTLMLDLKISTNDVRYDRFG
jgi:toluene monooxygenase electron transfer component